MLFSGPARGQAPLSDRRVAYEIHVSLDEGRHVLQGTEHITWKNPDRVPVDELQFHLYLNGFRNRQSVWIREGGLRHRSFRARGDQWRGGVDIWRMQVLAGRRWVTVTPRFIDPEGANPGDSTVISVRLPEPVRPGGSVRVRLAFESRLPRVFARTGWAPLPGSGTFYMVGQWFPKLGVYEVPGQRQVPAEAPRGRWNTHPFHLNTEFYADFGTYRVSIDVPRTYTVGATGVRVAGRTRGQRRTFTYRADDVHDFAWTASPSFFERTDRWKHVRIRLLLQPAHADQADRLLEATHKTLAYLEQTVGPYPYTTLTLVDALEGATGMEYPTLVTFNSIYRVPGGIRLPEEVLVHELAHQYFYGILASNEAEEAWLDEGFASYIETRILESTYGHASMVDFAGLTLNSGQTYRMDYAEPHPVTGRVLAPARTYSPGTYARLSYSKSVVVLTTLEGLLGRPTMDRVLREYYRRWAFRHPTTRDFIQTAEDVSGRNLDWYFDQFVYGDRLVDYAVEDIRGREEGSLVIIRRLQSGFVPVSILVRFDDGSSRTVAWDGRAARKILAFDRRVTEARIDPENRVWLDVNPVNNRRVVRADGQFAQKMHLKAATWLQQFLQLSRFLF